MLVRFLMISGTKVMNRASVAFLSCFLSSSSFGQDTVFYKEIVDEGYWEPMLNLSAAPPRPACFYSHSWHEKQNPEADRYSEYIIATMNGKFGVYSEKHEEIIPMEYESLSRVWGVHDVVFIAKNEGKLGLITEYNRVIWPFEFDRFYSIGYADCCMHMDGLFLAEKAGKFGLLRSDGTAKIDVKYDYVAQSYGVYECPEMEMLTRVGINGKFGMIDSAGNVVVPIQFDEIRADHLYPVYYGQEIMAKYARKWGLISVTGEVLIPHQFDDLLPLIMWPYTFEHAAKTGDKWGVVEKGGREIMPPLFDSIEQIYTDDWGFVKVMMNGKWGMADTNGTVLIPTEFDDLEGHGSNCFSYPKGDRHGFVSADGRVLTPAKYDEIHETDGALALVKCGETWTAKWGVVNMRTGKEIAAPVYNAPLNPHNGDYLSWGFYDYGLMCWRKGEKYGLIDTNGTIVAPFIYDQYIFTSDYPPTNLGFFPVYKNDKQYLMSPQGKILTDLDFDDYKIDEYSTGILVFISKKNHHGIMSPEGKIIIPPIYDKIEFQGFDYDYSSPGIMSPGTYGFLVEMNGKLGLIDSVGNGILPCIYESIERNHYNNFDVILNGKTGVVDKYGKVLEALGYETSVILPGGRMSIRAGDYYRLVNADESYVDSNRYSSIELLEGGQIVVQLDNKYSLLDSNLKVIIPAVYDVMIFYKNNIAAVMENYRYGFIDITGKIIDSCKYYDVGILPGGYFSVQAPTLLYGINDTDGTPFLTPAYEKIKYFDRTFAAVKVNGLYGFVNGIGEAITDFKYEKVKDIRGNHICVRTNDLWGVVDRTGKEILPAKYADEIDLTKLWSTGYTDVRTIAGHGLIDTAMKEIVPCLFDWWPVVRQAGTFRYIFGFDDDSQSGAIYSVDGDVIIPPGKYFVDEQILERTHVLITRYADTLYGLTDTTGKILASHKYRKISGYIPSYSERFNWENPQPYLIYQIEDKFGILSITGAELTKAIYDEYGADAAGLLLKKGEKWISVEETIKK